MQGSTNGQNVGFVGLGNMGGHMAMNLVKKGRNVVVFDVNHEAMAKLKVCLLASSRFSLRPFELCLFCCLLFCSLKLFGDGRSGTREPSQFACVCLSLL